MNLPLLADIIHVDRKYMRVAFMLKEKLTLDGDDDDDTLAFSNIAKPIVFNVTGFVSLSPSRCVR